MALSSGMDVGVRGGASCDDEIKTQFMTREGIYRLMTLSEYSRPNRVGYANNGQAGTMAGCTGAPVRVSFVSLPRPMQDQQHQQASDPGGGGGGSNSDSNGYTPATIERITFNYGREIFVYPYRGVKKAADLTKPIDKRIYKGTFPTCHDFGTVTEESEVVPLVVGFSGGQIQLVDPIRKELSKLFNEERNVDKARVTCIKWIPGSRNSFLVAHASGCMYVYNYEVACANTVPSYQMFKQGKGYSVHTCKTKTTRNPIYKWAIGRGAINEFAFSPCGHFIAVASQDGFLRIFNYDTMELIGFARSYFGGLLCVCWSPDGKFIVCGGEDDLVTVYSVEEKRVVIRGQGHKSWVSVVAFDQFNMSYGDLPDGLDFSGSDEEGPSGGEMNHHQTAATTRRSAMSATTSSSLKKGSSVDSSNNVTCYRFGSVGQDTLLCLWDITEDLLRQSRTLASQQHLMMNSHFISTPLAKQSPSSFLSIMSNSGASGAGSQNSSQNANKSSGGGGGGGSGPVTGNHVIPSSSSPASSSKDSGLVDAGSNCSSNSAATNNTPTSTASNSLSQRLASLNFGGSDKSKSDKKNSSGRSGSASTSGILGTGSSKNSSQTSLASGLNSDLGDSVDLGSPQCPRIHETPLIEPLVAKKIAHERLTALVFREDCLVTACQDGYVCTWARPGKVNTNPSNVMCPGSPQPAPTGGGGGNSTVV